MTDSHELTISLFFAALKQVNVYSAKITMGTDLNFTGSEVYKNIDDIETLDYSHNCSGNETGSTRNSVKLVS